MKLYLSAFGLGADPAQFVEFADGASTATVIMNAGDHHPPEIRAERFGRQADLLADVGIATVELDLRDFFDRDDVAGALAAHPLVWVPGGNVFLLRAAMRLSGADSALCELLRNDTVAYGGFSAGGCVLAPSLEGLDLVDDPAAVRAVYGVPARFDGLGILEFAFVPHYRSAHPESARIDRVAEHYERQGAPYRTFRDGEVWHARW